MAGQVVILMGSKGDLDHVKQITAQLDAFGLRHKVRVASAHKSVRHLLAILEAYAEAREPTVFIAVAGRSNALAGMVDANTPWPVITCPPVSTAFAGADIYSSLRMPSGVAPMVVLDPAGAAVAAAKILAVASAPLREHVGTYHEELTDSILAADQSIRET